MGKEGVFGYKEEQHIRLQQAFHIKGLYFGLQ